MLSPHHTQFWTTTCKDKSVTYKCEVFLSDDFSKLNNFKQSYAIILSDDNKSVLIVKNRSASWIFPGGGIEEGETPIECLVREVIEETNCDVDTSSIKPFYYQLVSKELESGTWTPYRTELRFTCKLKTERKFVSDPDNGDILENKWVKIEELDKYLKWGDTTKMIMKILS